MKQPAKTTDIFSLIEDRRNFRPASKLDPLRAKQMVALRCLGASWKELKEIYGVSTATMRKVVKNTAIDGNVVDWSRNNADERSVRKLLEMRGIQADS